MGLGMYLAVMPHCFYIYNLRFTVDKIWYIRGGHWKIQNSGIQGLLSYAHTEPSNLKVSDGDTELSEDGSLQDDILLKAEEWQEYYQTVDNQMLHILSSGTVHNPEIFQAMLNHLKIDDSNFVINIDPENSSISKKCIGK